MIRGAKGWGATAAAMAVVLALAAPATAVAQVRTPEPAVDPALDARLQAGRDLMDHGRWAEAIPVFQDLTQAAEARSGAAAELTLTARSWLAFALLNGGRMDEAFVVAHAVEAAGAPVLGPDHEATDRVRTLLALEDLRAGRVAEATARLEAGLRRNRAAGDQANVSAISTLLVLLYTRAGREQDARDLLATNAATGEFADINMIQRGGLDGDDALQLAAADRLLARSGLPLGLRAQAAVTRARVLGRRADAGDAEAGREAERSLRAALADPALKAEPLTRLSLQDALADRLAPVGVDEVPDARLAEATALWRDGVAQTAVLLGDRHPTTLQRRLDLATRLTVQGGVDEALGLYEAVLAADDAAPGLLNPFDRALTESGRASLIVRKGRTAEGYAALRAAGARWRSFELSTDRGDRAAGLREARFSVFRTQVALAWALAGTGAALQGR